MDFPDLYVSVDDFWRGFGDSYQRRLISGGSLLAFHLTPGNVDDRQPVEFMTTGLRGLPFGDKGCISQSLFEELYARGLKLITNLAQKHEKNAHGRHRESAVAQAVAHRDD